MFLLVVRILAAATTVFTFLLRAIAPPEGEGRELARLAF